MLELRKGNLRVRLDPEIGGTVTDFSLEREGNWLALMRQSPEPLDKSSNGAFLMAPYSNRIRDGKFLFEGSEYQLRDPEKHSRHGDVRERPWSVAESSSSEIELELDSTSFADFNYPFPFVARLSYRLSEDSFESEFSIRNSGQTNMPAGGGFHPYFNRALGKNDEQAELSFDAKGVYLYSGDLPLPEGAPNAIPEELSFQNARLVQEGIDHCYSDWSRSGTILWPKSEIKLSFSASTEMSHLILYSPPGEPFFAFEPVTMATDGFNLLTKDIPSGTVVLGPGETLRASYRIEVVT